MPDFTQGKWWIAPPIFDGDVIYALPTEEGRRNDVVAMGILNNADARLIANAPDMYKLLEEFCKIYSMKAQCKCEDNSPAFMMALVAEHDLVNMARELLDRIDSKEGEHEWDYKRQVVSR